MSRRALGVLAIVIILLMGFIVLADLDGLPRATKREITNTAQLLDQTRAQVKEARTVVERALANDPNLFQGVSAQIQGDLRDADRALAAADKQRADLQQLVQQNKRAQSEQAERGVAQLKAQLDQASTEAGNARKEVERLVSFRRELPQRLAAMERDYNAVRAFDVQSSTVNVHRAMTDWPAKKEELARTLGILTGRQQRAEQAYTGTAEARAKAAANDLAAVSIVLLSNAFDELAKAAKDLPSEAATLNNRVNELYAGWDKVLLQLDEDNTPRQRVRQVTTKYSDATLANPQVAEKEQWENIDAARAKQLEEATGMVVERKEAGKFDAEAEKQIQAPGLAYIAPPGQSNRYGSWNNGVWSWLPQYLILSQLLNRSSVPSFRYDDYYGYQNARRSGGIYYGGYGRAAREAAERYREYRNSGSADRRPGEGFYRERTPGTPSYGGSGTFGSSRYRSRGTFGSSPYSSGGGFGSRSYSRGYGGGGMRRGGRR